MAKICILLPTHWGAFKGGAEFQAHCLAKHLVETTQNEVVYLAVRVPETSDMYPYDLRKIPSRLGRMRYRFGFFWDAPSIYSALKHIRPDVVIQRVASAYTGVAAYYCAKFNARMIWHVSSDKDVGLYPDTATRGVPGAIDRAMLRYGIKHAHFIIAQTNAQAAALKSSYGRCATAVVPNFHPLPSLGQHQKRDCFTVVWVAALKPLKQPELFVRLASEFADQLDIQFRLIGRSTQDPWCSSVLRSASETPNLKYLGELEMEEVNRELARAHVLVNTSIYEGFSNVFIQAWMRGVPVLSLNVDPDSLMERFRLGFRTNSFENLRSRLLDLYNDRALLEQTGIRAKTFAHANYSMANADRICSIVQSAINPR